MYHSKNLLAFLSTAKQVVITFSVPMMKDSDDMSNQLENN